MPISNNASYMPTMNEFVAHWGQVNAELSPPLTVLNEEEKSHTLAQFTALQEAIRGQAAVVIDVLNDQEIARGYIDLRKAQLFAWLSEFNEMLAAYWGRTVFIKARPMAPTLSLGEEKFTTPLRDMESLWGKLNEDVAPMGVTLPLALSDGTTVEAFGAALALLPVAYKQEAKSAQDVVLARARREASKRTAYLTMKAYRLAVPPRCKQLPELVSTLPALTPPPGHTPDPVNASALFEAPDQAKVVYEASEEAELDHYELRGNPGEAYSDDDAVTIESRQPDEAREFLSGFGLTQPGARVALKVYVVLKTGNEAGSAAMLVARPG